MSETSLSPGIALAGETADRYGEVLNPEALAFVADLHRTFEPRRRELMGNRVARQKKWDAGALPGFLDETSDIRGQDWRVGTIPADLQDRRVELTGPTDRKMVINALNSGANVFMADFEDASAPTWSNMVDGQLNLYDFAHGGLEFTDPGSGKHYAVADDPAVLLVRPRGWHLLEAHMLVDGDPVSAGIFDFGR